MRITAGASAGEPLRGISKEINPAAVRMAENLQTADIFFHVDRANKINAPMTKARKVIVVYANPNTRARSPIIRSCVLTNTIARGNAKKYWR